MLENQVQTLTVVENPNLSWVVCVVILHASYKTNSFLAGSVDQPYTNPIQQLLNVYAECSIIQFLSMLVLSEFNIHMMILLATGKYLCVYSSRQQKHNWQEAQLASR